MDYDEPASVITEKWQNKWERSYLDSEGELPNGAILLLARPYSMHPGDWYLSVIFAQLPNNDVTPYVTWECNVSFEEPHYFAGHYFKSKEEAFEDWKKR
jgi:hypothetical protein